MALFIYFFLNFRDILWVQLVLLPYWILQYISWYCRWIWKFWIKKDEYGIEEKLYIIRKNLKMSQGQFDALDEYVKEGYISQQLWIAENFRIWKEARDSEIRAKLAQSGKYKAYRRYLKANGPGRIYFDDS